MHSPCSGLSATSLLIQEVASNLPLEEINGYQGSPPFSALSPSATRRQCNLWPMAACTNRAHVGIHHLDGRRTLAASAGAWWGVIPPQNSVYDRPMTKQDLHRLVDSLPEESVEAAAILLARVRNPELAAMYALPYDDEPYTQEEQQQDRAVADAYKRGDKTFVSLDELDAEITSA